MFIPFNKNVLVGIALAILLLAILIFGPIKDHLTSSRQALCRQHLSSFMGWVNDYNINKGHYPKTIEMLDEIPELHNRVLKSYMYCPVTKKKYIYNVSKISGKEFALLGDSSPHLYTYNYVYQTEGAFCTAVTLPVEFYKSHEEFISVMNNFKILLDGAGSTNVSVGK